jgi:adenylosuccinate synthase
VTSSNPVSASACTGTGVGPKDIDEIWGIAKAYATRVGSGPFPTELDDELGNVMREAGGEYGTTTGAPAASAGSTSVALRYAARLNTLTHLAVTKLDVLSGLGPLRVCTRYQSPERGELRPLPVPPDRPAPRRRHLTRSCPAGTRTSRSAAARTDLPQAARDYLAYISDVVGVPIAIISVGPGRDQVIWTETGKQTATARRAAIV